MKKSLLVLSLVGTCAVVGHAAKIDARLATVRKAFVVPADELGDDRGVATCLANRLSQKTPIASVATRDEADVVFTIKAHVPSGTSRMMLGVMGGSPSANLAATLPDGTKLWADGAKARRGNVGAITLARGENPIGCALADGLLETLLDAMKDARDQK